MNEAKGGIVGNGELVMVGELGHEQLHLVGPAVTTPAPTTSQTTVVGPGAEYARYRLEDLKAASRGSWPMSARLDPKTFQRLEDLADPDVLHINGNTHDLPQ